MIFVSVGTTHYPFARLVRCAADLPHPDVFVQHGPAPPPVGVARAVPFLDYEHMTRAVEEADVVVCHAGVGTILLAAQAGHMPVVVPRMKHLGEAVDDHQRRFAQALAERGVVIIANDGRELEAAIARVPPRRPPREAASTTPLQVAVREAIACSR